MEVRNIGANGNELKLEGKIFGDLKVIRKHTERDDKNRILWVCTCKCNPKEELLVCGHYLTSRKTDNCGCKTKIRMSEVKRRYNTYDLTGEYGVGYTRKGEEFYFDLEDYEKIKDYCWNLHGEYIEARDIKNKDCQKNVKMHRLVMNVNEFKMKVDHIFHKANDNRKSQLRVCNNQQNTLNHKVSKSNTSGKSGISYRKDTGKWRARIWFKGDCYNLGSFFSYEEAVKVRSLKEVELFKEYRYEG